MIYEYVCTKCGRKKDIKKLISKRNEEEKCVCGEILVRMIGRSRSFILKGKGFYCNREQDK